MKAPSKKQTRKNQRLREFWWRLSLRYRGDKFRLKLLNRFAAIAMDHLMIPGRPSFIAGIDSRGRKTYVMCLDWNGEIPRETKVAFRAYMRRKLEQVFAIDKERAGFEIAIRDHKAQLPVHEQDISSAWLTECIQRAMRAQERRAREADGEPGSEDSWYQPAESPTELTPSQIQENIAKGREQLEQFRSARAAVRKPSPSVMGDEIPKGAPIMPQHYLGIREGEQGFEGILTGYAGLWTPRKNAAEDIPTQPMPYEISTQQFDRSEK